MENNFLSNPLWKGSSEDLPRIFPDGSPERQSLQGLSFGKDYFPHGGILGAARIGMPAVIVDALPDDFWTMVDPNTDFFGRLGAAGSLISNHVLAMSEVGSMAYYVPAPNPPLAFFTTEQGLSGPRGLIDAISTFDPANPDGLSLYPFEAGFLKGYMEGRLLGIPISRADIEAIPSDPQTGTDSHFRVSTGIPEGSWIAAFLESAELVFEIRQSPPRTIQDRFTALETQFKEVDAIVRELRAAQNFTESNQRIEAFLDELQDCLAKDLPKLSLEASVNNLRVPAPLDQLLVAANANARLVAYSPRFEPEFAGDGPLALARQNGGIALKGNFRFGNLITVDNAELAVFPEGALNLPSLAGRFEVPNVTVAPGIVFTDNLLDFNSQPESGAPFLNMAGKLIPFNIGLLQVAPLQTGANRLAGSLSMISNADGLPKTTLSVDPARVTLPVFGDDLRMEIHGAETNAPFTFSTSENWEAVITVQGDLELRDLLTGTTVLRVSPSSERFAMNLSGTGVSKASIELEIPLGTRATVFPGNAALQTSLTLGAAQGSRATLAVSTDGSFALNAVLAQPLTLAGLPITGIESQATVQINPNGALLTGMLAGDDSGVSAQGTILINRNGIALSGQATIPPIQHDFLTITGANGGNIEVTVDSTGIHVPSGALLSYGITDSTTLVLRQFDIANNGDFNAAVSGSYGIAGFYRIDSGAQRLVRRDGVVTLELEGAQAVMFPDHPRFEQAIPKSFDRLVVDSAGRFYLDLGSLNRFTLPGFIESQGRLELGFEPSPRTTLVQLSSTRVNLGSTKIGQVAQGAFRLTNTGQTAVVVAAALTGNQAFTIAPANTSLAPGEIQEFSIQFVPIQAGSQSASVSLTYSGQAPPRFVTLTGAGQSFPIYHQSVEQLAFGQVPAGGGDLKTILLSNLGTAPLRIDSITTASPFTVLTSEAQIQPGDSRLLLVSFVAPNSPGPVTGKIQLTTNDERNNGRFEIPLAAEVTQKFWHVEYETVSQGALNRLVMWSATHGVAAGAFGNLVKTTSSGDGWTPIAAPGIHLNDLAANTAIGSTRKIWAAGDSGFVLETSDPNLAKWRRVVHSAVAFGGANWRGVAVRDTVSGFIALAGRQGDISRGTIVMQTAADQFTTLNLGNVAGLNDISFATSAIGVAVGDLGTILRTTDGGTTWTRVSLPVIPASGFNLHSVDFGASGVCLAAGDFGAIWRSSNSGASFTLVNNPSVTAALREVWIEGSLGLIAGDNQTFLFSNNSGRTWTQENIGLPGTGNYLGVSRIGTDFRIATSRGEILRRPSSPPAGPIAGLSREFIDFGTVPLGGRSVQTLTVFNRGTRTLKIDGVSAGRSDLFVSESSFEIQPGQSRLLRLIFQPVSPVNPAPFEPNGVISLQSSQLTSPLSVALRLRSQRSHWVPRPTGVNVDLIDLHFVSETFGFALHEGGLLRTFDGGETWFPVTTLNPPGPLRALHVTAPPNQSITIWVAGGQSTSPFIMRSTTFGSSWQTVPIESPITGHVVDLRFESVEHVNGYAVTAFYDGGGVNRRKGTILRYVPNEQVWRGIASIPATFNSGGTLDAYSGNRYYASSGGELFRGIGNVADSLFNLGGVFPIYDIHVRDLTAGWLSGENGLLLRSSGNHFSNVQWESVDLFTSGRVTSLHFANRTTGWCVASGGNLGPSSAIFKTQDGGVVWTEELVTRSPIRRVFAFGNAAFAVGPNGSFWRLDSNYAAPPIGMLNAPFQVRFNDESVGAAQRIEVRNIGNADLKLSQIRVEDRSSNGAFALESSPLSKLAPGQTTTVGVRFDPDVPGTFRGELILLTDGIEPSVRVALEGVRTLAQQAVVFETIPAGLMLDIDGQSYSTPVAFTVTDSPSRPDHWLPNSVHTIAAPRQQTREGLAYGFASWSPTNDRAFEWRTVETGNGPARFAASYVRTVDLAQARRASSSERMRNIQLAAATPSVPNDVPQGPWIRLSNGHLAVPLLGNLDLLGNAFISLNRIRASLSAGEMRFPDIAGTTPLFHATAGSWNLDYQLNSFLRLNARSPGVSVLNNQLSPPTDFNLLIQGTDNFQVSFANTSIIPLVPGMVELGPGNVSLSRDPLLQLTVNGELRAIRTPNNAWAYRKPVTLALREIREPIVISGSQLPASLFRNDFVDLRTDANSRMVIDAGSDGVFGFRVERLRAVAFGHTFVNLSGIAANGVLRFAAESTASPYRLAFGPFELKTDLNTEFLWNARSAQIRVELPSSTLNIPGLNGWPQDTIGFPKIEIDAGGYFDRTIPLPAISFRDLALGGQNDELKNFVRFFNRPAGLGLELQSQQDFIGMEMQFALNVGSNRKLTGSMEGSFLGVCDMALQYDDNWPLPYQFRGLVNCLGLSYGVYYGSGGARSCQLVCSQGQSLADCIELFCVTP
ncbi:MAG: choice-of-anchor D domain-containing protein [Verrucomicrobia bacterium]|nr:choice-of-anchor D domain-containing protein [Verrucomicrobiota bacterium]